MMLLQIKILGAEDEQLLDRVVDGVFDRPVDRRLLREFLRDDRHHLCVGFVEGTVVGFASAVH